MAVNQAKKQSISTKNVTPQQTDAHTQVTYNIVSQLYEKTNIPRTISFGSVECLIFDTSMPPKTQNASERTEAQTKIIKERNT